MYLNPTRDNLLFYLDKSILYHQRRERFFRNLWKLSITLMVLPIVIMEIFNLKGLDYLLVIALAIVILLTFITNKAIDKQDNHMGLVDWYASIIYKISHTTKGNLEELQKEIIQIDEAASINERIHWILNADCYNIIAIKRNLVDKDFIFISRWQRLFMHLFLYRNMKYKSPYKI